jgi:hypothetical protein
VQLRRVGRRKRADAGHVPPVRRPRRPGAEGALRACISRRDLAAAWKRVGKRTPGGRFLTGSVGAASARHGVAAAVRRDGEVSGAGHPDIAGASLCSTSVPRVGEAHAAVAYVVHAWRSPRIDKDQRTLWVLVLLLGAPIAMPIYWWLYVRPGGTSREREPASPGIPS